MSEIAIALLRNAPVEDIAKRRLDILSACDLFGIMINEERKLEVIDSKRRQRGTFIASLKILRRHGIREDFIAKALFAYDFLDWTPFLPSNNPDYVSGVIMGRILSARGVSYSSILATPLAYSILFNLSPLTLTQMVVAVDGVAGVGKTSLVYSSVKAVLLALGLSEKEAQELFLATYIQRLEELAELVKLAESRNIRLPIIVFDDAATSASAYLWFSQSRNKLIELAKLLTIARERIANLVIVGPYSAIFKGIRRLVHMVFQPVTRYERVPGGRRLVVTLWNVAMQDRLVDMMGTVTPHPLKVDDSVYVLISEVKKRIREEVAEKLGAQAESGEKEGADGGEPGP
jgi:hypothetical protein